MIIKLFRSLLKLDKNDQEIERLQSKAQKDLQDTVVVLKKQGRLQEKMIQKTTSYYIAKGLGALR